MNNGLIYARFSDGSIFHLKDAKIEFFPNQNFSLNLGSKVYGTVFSLFPKAPCQVDGYLLDGRAHFLLKFSNIASEKFFKEPFWVDKVKFILTESGPNGCVAEGVYDGK